MAKRAARKKSVKTRKSASAGPPFDPNMFENVHQVGGIQTATLDAMPGVGGQGQGTRVAFVNTGGGLRFVVALDRGGDIVQAHYNETSLSYLSPNGYAPPSHANNAGIEWLRNWPAGLVTTCGPNYFGPPREEDGNSVGLHGNHSNTPAAVEMLLNPDPHQGRNEMLLSMVIRDSRMFGPVIEVRRQIQCKLGLPHIVIHDHITNRGNTRVAHNWMYHCNLGYPLVDAGAKLVYRGKAHRLDTDKPQSSAALNRFKKVTGPIEAHVGTGESVMMIDPKPDRNGVCHVGLVNSKKGLALELEYDHEALPRLANWQHFGPRGSYVTGLEPFSGSLLGKKADHHPLAAQWLEPGETKRYQMTIKVHADRAGIASLSKHDGLIASA